MRRLWPLTVRGTGAAVLAVACFVIAHEAGIAVLVYFGLVLCATLAGSIVSLHLARRTETVSRALQPDVAAVGRETSVTVRAGLRSALPTTPGRWHDTVGEGLSGDAQGVFPAVGSGLRGGDPSITLRYTVTGSARGTRRLGPLTVTATDPFGLARRVYALGGTTAVTVAPAIVDLAPLPDGEGDAGGTRSATTTQLGQGSDNLVARPYAPGDSMRRIHWRATAHRDEIMVRQEEQESSPEATVVLDRGARRWGEHADAAPGVDPEFEAGVSACVSAVSRLVHEGYTVNVVDSDGAPLFDAIDGGETHDVEAFAAHLADLVARRGDHLPQVGGLFAGDRTGPVVVVTGHVTTSDVESLAVLPHHSTLPVMLCSAAGEDVLRQLRDTGWRTARIRPDSDLAAAWREAIGTEAAHVIA